MLAFVHLSSQENLLHLQEVQDGIAALNAADIQYKDFCFKAHSQQEQLDILYAALDDPEVDTLLFVKGGNKSIRCLDTIDWNRLGRSGKRFIGSSDYTHLFWPLIITDAEILYGPTLSKIGKLSATVQKPLFETLSSGLHQSVHYKTLFGDVEMHEIFQIVGGHLMMNNFLISAHITRISSHLALFIEHHYVSGESIDDVLYHLDQMIYLLKGNLPRFFLLGDIFTDNGNLQENAEAVAAYLSRLEVPVLWIPDCSSVYVPFNREVFLDGKILKV